VAQSVVSINENAAETTGLGGAAIIDLQGAGDRTPTGDIPPGKETGLQTLGYGIETVLGACTSRTPNHATVEPF
jgi:hypothetical protein